MGADSAFFDLAVGGIDGVEVDFERVVGELKPGAHLLALSPIATHHSNTISIEDAGMEIRDTVVWVFDSGGQTPDMVLVTVARKPLEGTVAANVLTHGTGGLNVDGCRVGNEGGCAGAGAGAGARVYGSGLNGTFAPPVPGLGRWPANLIHDGSDEVVGLFPQGGSGSGQVKVSSGRKSGSGSWAQDHGMQRAGAENTGVRDFGDFGSAARFFYSAPCLNDLLKYLLKLITPPGGTVLTNCNNILVQSAYPSVKYDED